MPVRVQLSRAKGWRMPENTVKVDRTTRFGNPSLCTRPHNCSLAPCECCGGDRCCVLVFREYVTSGLEGRSSETGSLSVALDAYAGYPRRARLVEGLPSLRGKNLACWCKLDAPCHADVLLELANREPTREAGGPTEVQLGPGNASNPDPKVQP
jgi:hypothetical protein